MNIKYFFDQATFFFLCALILLLPFSSAAVEICSTLAILTGLIHKIIHKQFSFKLSALSITLGCCIIATLISVIFSQFPEASHKAFITKFLQNIFTFIVAFDTLNSNERLNIFFNCFIVSVSVVILNTGIQWINGRDLFKGYDAMEGYRFRSSFIHPNDFATYMSTSLGILIALTVAKKEKIWKWMLIIISILSLVCVFVSFSRAGYLAVICAGIIFLVIKKYINQTFFLACLLIGLTGIGVVTFNLTHALNNNVGSVEDVSWSNRLARLNQSDQVKKVIKRVKSYQNNGMFNKLNRFSSDRLIYWVSAFGIAQESPWVGTGLNTFAKKAKQYKDPDQDYELYAHNCFVQMFVELGLLGLITFVFFLWAWFDRMNKVLNQRQVPLIVGFICALTAYLVTAFLDTPLYTGQLSIYFWLMLGVGVASTKISSSSSV